MLLKMRTTCQSTHTGERANAQESDAACHRTQGAADTGARCDPPLERQCPPPPARGVSADGAEWGLGPVRHPCTQKALHPAAKGGAGMLRVACVQITATPIFAIIGTRSPDFKAFSGLDALPSRPRFLTPCTMAARRKKEKARQKFQFGIPPSPCARSIWRRTPPRSGCRARCGRRRRGRAWSRGWESATACTGRPGPRTDGRWSTAPSR